MRILIGVGFLVLLLPASSQAATARARVLNASSSGAVTFTVDGKARAAKVVARGVSKRFALSAGFHTFAARRGATTVATRTIGLKSGERLTVVYALSSGQPVLQLLREPVGVGSGTLLRVANYSGRAGPVDVRVGRLTIAQALGPGHTSVTRRVTGALSPTGQIAVSARRTATGGVVTATQKLVLATRSVGLFALVPTPAGSRLIRLPYDVTPPTPKALPRISGTRRFGHTVSCGAGTWTPKASRLARRWTLDGVALSGGASLKLSTAANAGHVLGCAVSASSHGMTTRVRTTFALPGVPTPIVPPAILVPGGTLQSGDVATCDVGKWAVAPTVFAIRWVRVRDGQVVGTGDRYTLSLATDNGINNVVVCEVTATNDGGVSLPSESQNSVALNIAPTVAIDRSPGLVPLDGNIDPTWIFHWAIGGGGADTITCLLDGTPQTCIGAAATTVPRSGSFTAAALGTSHTFTVVATNAAGPATDSYTWLQGPPAPTVAIDKTLGQVPTNPTTDTTATFTWALGTAPVESVTCEVDSVPSGGGPPTSGVPFSCVPPESLSMLQAGTTYTLIVTASNLTRAVSDSYTWMVQ